MYILCVGGDIELELHILEGENGKFPLLLDDEMKIVKPVYEYMKKLKSDNKADNTLIANGRDLKIYWDFLIHNYYVYDEITPRHIQQFREFLFKEKPYDSTPVLYQESKRTPTTINRILSTIYNFYVYLGEVHEVGNPILMKEINRGFNVFKGFLEHARAANTTVHSIFKVKEVKSDFNILTLEQIKQIRNAIDNKRDRLIWILLASTGARIQEKLGLQIKNVPYIDHSEEMSILKNVKSKGKKRDILIPTHTLIELDNYIMEERYNVDADHDYIFVALNERDKGNPLSYSAIYQSFEDIKTKVGFNFNFHDLRHTFATNLVEVGIDVIVIKGIMGHKHVSTTSQYIHLAKKYEKEVLTDYWKKVGKLEVYDES